VYVACLREPTGIPFYYYDLFRVALDGAGAERLTVTLGATEFYPSWSPDGERVAFLADVDSRSDSRMRLYTMAVDGTDVQSVLDDDFIVLHEPPQWSPDGRYLALVRYPLEKRGVVETISQSGRELYVVGAEGSEPRRLADNVVSGPSWSPDGQQLTFARANADGVALYTIGSDGADELWITDIEYWCGPHSDSLPTEAWIDTVAWSPDGAQILVRSDEAFAFIVTLATGEITELWPGIRAASWSPNGSRIALLAGRWRDSGPLMVATMAADGSDLRVLAERQDPYFSDSGLRTQGGQAAPGAGDASACRGGGAVPNPDANDHLVRPCVELIRLQQRLVGGEALNWSPAHPMFRWDGVVLGGSPLAVRALDLRGYGLRGALGLESSWLPHLHTLVLRDNSLDGGIPPGFGHLSNLEILDLRNNQLTGSIPPELDELTKLRTLDLSSNQLSGEIPAWLAELPNLEEIALTGNQFTGCVPPGLPLRDRDELGLPNCATAT
jgi:Tol biopolymer transport system component